MQNTSIFSDSATATLNTGSRSDASITIKDFNLELRFSPGTRVRERAELDADPIEWVIEEVLTEDGSVVAYRLKVEEGEYRKTLDADIFRKMREDGVMTLVTFGGNNLYNAQNGTTSTTYSGSIEIDF